MKRSWLLILAALASSLAGSGCRSSAGTKVLGEDTTIVFEGMRAFDEEELYEVIAEDRQSEKSERASRAAVDDAAYALEEHYRRQGWADAVVDYEYVESDAGVTAVLSVSEGQRLTLASVAFQGNEGVDDETLSRFFLPETTALSMVTGRASERPFVQSQLRAATGQIETYYYQKGWLRMRVTDVSPRIDEETGSVHLTCVVQEGPRFRLSSVNLANADDTPIEDPVRIAFDKELKKRLNNPYTPPVAYGLRAALLEAAQKEGHADAVVTFESSLSADGEVALDFRLSPGPVVRIGQVRVEGTDGTRTSMVRDRMELEEGDQYDASRVRASFANLYRSGFFRSVSIELAEGGGEVRDLVVEVEELPSIELFVEPGYGSYEGPRLSFGADERNLFGTGTGLRFESTVGSLAQGAILSWNDPWIDDGRFETRVSLFGDHREEPSFTQTEFGTEWSLSRIWSETLRSSIAYRFRRNQLDDVELDVADPALEDALNDVNVASFTLGTTYDDRDALFVPTQGKRLNGSIEWASHAFGSEIDFLAVNVEAAKYYELSRRSVLALRVRSGIKAPIADTDVLPLQERFFNGGENTVRSFAEDELGPLDVNGESLGGQALNVWNVELRQKLTAKLDAALFYDGGSLASEFEDVFDLGNGVRSGFGVGLRYLLPIGPVRLDVGWNPSPRDDGRVEEDDFVVHFAIGMPF